MQFINIDTTRTGEVQFVPSAKLRHVWPAKMIDVFLMNLLLFMRGGEQQGH